MGNLLPIKSMALVGLSDAFASKNLFILLVLGVYIARIGILGAVDRCKVICPDIN